MQIGLNVHTLEARTLFMLSLLHIAAVICMSPISFGHAFQTAMLDNLL